MRNCKKYIVRSSQYSLSICGYKEREGYGEDNFRVYKKEDNHIRLYYAACIDANELIISLRISSCLSVESFTKEEWIVFCIAGTTHICKSVYHVHRLFVKLCEKVKPKSRCYIL